MKKLHSIITSIVILTITAVASAEGFSLSSLFGFDDDEKPAPPPPVKPIAWSSVKATNYNKIDVADNVSLMINPEHKHKSNLIIHEPDITAHVKNHTLYLQGKCISTADCNKSHNAFIKDISKVTYIHTGSNAKVYGQHLKKHKIPLTIYSEDNSKVVLNGVMNIKALKHDSSAASKILWLDAKDINVAANGGKLNMAGVANTIKIRANNKAQIEASQLRAKNSWVSTSDSAKVEIGALNYLYAHSEGSSMISYPELLRETVFITKDHSKIINSKLKPTYAK